MTEPALLEARRIAGYCQSDIQASEPQLVSASSTRSDQMAVKLRAR